MPLGAVSCSWFWQWGPHLALSLGRMNEGSRLWVSRKASLWSCPREVESDLPSPVEPASLPDPDHMHAAVRSLEFSQTPLIFVPLLGGNLKLEVGVTEHSKPSYVCNLTVAFDLEMLCPSPRTPGPSQLPLLRGSEKWQPLVAPPLPLPCCL